MGRNTIQIDIDVLERLRRFKTEHGCIWKSQLRKLWTSGKDEALLRLARNIIGPSGLDTIDLEAGTYKSW